MIVVPCSANEPLALRIANELGASLARVEVRGFPDGETYYRVLDDVKDEDVVLVQSAALKPNDYLVEFLLAADAVKDLGARRLVAVLAYFPYARQDERFKPGEAVSLLTVAKLIRAVGVDHLVTVDSHRHRVVDFEKLLGVPVTDVSAMPLLARYAVERRLVDEEVVVVGPDEEAESWASLAAREIGSEFTYLRKTRLGDREVRVEAARGIDVKGADVLIVDDIISTGGTIVEAYKLLKTLGAGRVVAGVTHALLVEGAWGRILRAGVEDVFSTDTVPNPTTRVSVAPVVAQAIRSVL